MRACKTPQGDRKALKCAKPPPTALSTLQTENEKLRAELEKVKRERDAAVEDLHKLCPAWKWDGQRKEADHNRSNCRPEQVGIT